MTSEWGSTGHRSGDWLRAVRPNTPGLIAIAIAIAIVVIRLPYGFSAVLQDEGFHLIGPLRLALGDSPFRDEAFSVLRASDVLMLPLFRLVPEGSVVFWRLVGFAFQVLTAIAALVFLRPMVPRTVAFGCCAAIVLFAPYNLWAPWYGNLAAVLVLVPTCMWLIGARHASKRAATAWSGIGGLLFSLLALNYTPLLALGVVPLAGLAVRPAREVRGNWVTATYAWLAGAALGVLLILAALWQAGLLRWAVISLAELRTVSVYSGSPLRSAFHRVLQSGYAGQAALVVLLFFALGAFVGRTRRESLARQAGFAGAVVLTCLYGAFAVELLVHPGPLVDQRFLTLGNLGLGALATGLVLVRWRSITAEPFGLHGVAVLCMGIGMAGVLAVVSAAGLPSLNGAAWIGWAGALACLTIPPAVPAQASARKPLDMRPSLLLAGAVVLAAAAHLLLWTYDDRPFWLLDARFESGKLRGVVTTADRRRDYASMVEEVRNRTAPGDFILAYDDLAWVYYLSDTRPAVRSSLMNSDRLPKEVQERWLDDMLSRGRVPRVVVTQRPPSGGSPFVKFISENYSASATAGAMTLWEPNSSISERRLPPP